MTPAERNAELLKKYGIATNPLPFCEDDVVSVTTQASIANTKSLVAAKPVKPIVVQVEKSSKFREVVKLKRKYTRRTIATDEESVESVPQRLRDLFKKSPDPEYTEFFTGQFPSAMEAASFASNYPGSTTEVDGFSHVALIPITDREVKVFIDKAKTMGVISFHIRRKII